MKIRTVYIIFYFLLFLKMAAQQDVCDSSACYVAKAGKYKIELEKKCSDRLVFYIHSPHDLTMENTEMIGYVDFFYLDNNFFIEEIYRYRGTNKLEVPIPYPGFFDFKISLVINKETVSATFHNECILSIWDRYKKAP
ncbi:MAG: hypothetical protein JNL60_05245 [Bacteroidia bacterium]|nr:hypothetical protein [Bacteroidia bacterium]